MSIRSREVAPLSTTSRHIEGESTQCMSQCIALTELFWLLEFLKVVIPITVGALGPSASKKIKHSIEFLTSLLSSTLGNVLFCILQYFYVVSNSCGHRMPWS